MHQFTTGAVNVIVAPPQLVYEVPLPPVDLIVYVDLMQRPKPVEVRPTSPDCALVALNGVAFQFKLLNHTLLRQNGRVVILATHPIEQDNASAFASDSPSCSTREFDTPNCGPADDSIRLWDRAAAPIPLQLDLREVDLSPTTRQPLPLPRPQPGVVDPAIIESLTPRPIPPLRPSSIPASPLPPSSPIRRPTTRKRAAVLPSSQPSSPHAPLTKRVRRLSPTTNPFLDVEAAHSDPDATDDSSDVEDREDEADRLFIASSGTASDAVNSSYDQQGVYLRSLQGAYFESIQGASFSGIQLGSHTPSRSERTHGDPSTLR